MTEHLPRLLVALLRAVARLAMPASEQLAYLRQIGVGDLADELALDLHDGMGLLSTFTEMGWLTPSELEILHELDQLLDAMSGPAKAQLWRTEGLSADERWNTVRQLARRFIFLQGQ